MLLICHGVTKHRPSRADTHPFKEFNTYLKMDMCVLQLENMTWALRDKWREISVELSFSIKWFHA